MGQLIGLINTDKSEIMNIKELSEEELMSISGGHKGFFYKAGVIWMTITLDTLGTLAGMGDGFRDNIK